jgi:hypothetical protein
MRTILLTLLLAVPPGAAAFAQIPAGPGQQPGTQAPAPQFVHPPPPAVSIPVPSSIQPARPSPTYGGPRGATSRTTYGTTPIYKPKPRHKKKRRPSTSEIVFIRTV